MRSCSGSCLLCAHTYVYNMSTRQAINRIRHIQAKMYNFVFLTFAGMSYRQSPLGFSDAPEKSVVKKIRESSLSIDMWIYSWPTVKQYRMKISVTISETLGLSELGRKFRRTLPTLSNFLIFFQTNYFLNFDVP